VGTLKGCTEKIKGRSREAAGEDDAVG
jgi:hypothetical protein